MTGAIGIGTAIYLNNLVGYLSLLISFMIGIVGTQIYYVPKLTEKWKQTGIPGEPKTPEQQETSEQERKKEQVRRNLSILAGIIIIALLRQLSIDWESFFYTFSPIVFGGIAGYFFRYGLLIYHQRGRLG